MVQQSAHFFVVIHPVMETTPMNAAGMQLMLLLLLLELRQNVLCPAAAHRAIR